MRGGAGLRRSHGGRGGGLAAQALHDVGPLDAAQGRQEGVERGAVLGGPAGEQGADGAGLVGEGVYVLRLVAQLIGQVPPGVPRRAVEQLLHLLPLGRWQAAVEASVPLERCREPRKVSRSPPGLLPPAGAWRRAKPEKGWGISPLSLQQRDGQDESWMGLGADRAVEGAWGGLCPPVAPALSPPPNPLPISQQLIKAEEETGLLSPGLNCSKCPGAGLWATN